MAQTIEDKLHKALTNALNGVSGLAVQPGVAEPWTLSDGTAQILPLRTPRSPAGGGKQRWTHNLLVTVTGRIAAPSETLTEWAAVRELVKAARDAVDSDATRAAIVAAGGEQPVRHEVSYWVKPPASQGSPAGASFRVEITYTE